MITLVINHVFLFWSPWITTCICYIYDNMHYTWAKICQKYFRFKIKIIGDNELFIDQPCIYLTNHRSQADFFVDQLLVKGRAIFIARWMVAVFIPFIPIYYYGRSLFFFYKKNNIEEIYKSLTKYKLNSPYPCILVYPEGTRNQNNTSLRLKTGFIKYAYQCQYPIQIFNI